MLAVSVKPLSHSVSVASSASIMSAHVPAPLGKLERDKQLAMLLKLGRRRPDAIAELKYYVEHARPLLVRGFPMDRGSEGHIFR